MIVLHYNRWGDAEVEAIFDVLHESVGELMRLSGCASLDILITYSAYYWWGVLAN